jgi:hypothetical protein
MGNSFSSHDSGDNFFNQSQSVLDKQGFKRIDPAKVNSHVVLCLDQDLKGWKSDALITHAVQQLKAAGKTVWIAMPDVLQNQKTDFNNF